MKPSPLAMTLALYHAESARNILGHTIGIDSQTVRRLNTPRATIEDSLAVVAGQGLSQTTARLSNFAGLILRPAAARGMGRIRLA